jgi:hypothetical protein
MKTHGYIAHHYRTTDGTCGCCHEPCRGEVKNCAYDPKPPRLEVVSNCCDAECYDDDGELIEPRHLWIEERCHHAEGDVLT